MSDWDSYVEHTQETDAITGQPIPDDLGGSEHCLDECEILERRERAADTFTETVMRAAQEVMAQRDHARALAQALEEELARKDEALRRIAGECGWGAADSCVRLYPFDIAAWCTHCIARDARAIRHDLPSDQEMGHG